MIMKMKKMKNKKSLLIAIGVALSASIAIGSVATYALFVARDMGTQQIKASAGLAKKSLFLDCDDAWNYDGATYYAVYFNVTISGSSTIPTDSSLTYVSPSKIITIGTTGSWSAAEKNLYVFEFDTTAYDQIMFIRGSDTGLDDADTSTYTSLTTNSDSSIWGLAGWIASTDTHNYFHIDSYKNNEKWCNYSSATATVTTVGSTNVLSVVS